MIIEVKNLVKVYGNTKALDRVTLEVKTDEIFAILGPNGAGKTTLIEILEGLRIPTSGEAKVLGFDVIKDRDKIRRKVGVLPQDFAAFDRLTVEENISLFSSLYNGLDVSELITLVGLEQWKKVRFQELSGGLKQRVGIACALAGNPDLVFLDEPTTGLDPIARRETWEVIENLRGKTVVLTTHYMEEAEKLADRVAIIVSGRIVACDSVEELKRKFGKLRLVVHGETRRELEVESFEEIYRILQSLDKPYSFEIVTPTLEEIYVKLVS
jgi:ABC-2 type transport system ATP-binding protein